MEENILLKKRAANFTPCTKSLRNILKLQKFHLNMWELGPKILERRRQVWKYMYKLSLEDEELPKLFPDFLNVWHLPSLPRRVVGLLMRQNLKRLSANCPTSRCCYLRDPHLAATSDFPNVVTGVLWGCLPSPPARLEIPPGQKRLKQVWKLQSRKLYLPS